MTQHGIYALNTDIKIVTVNMDKYEEVYLTVGWDSWEDRTLDNIKSALSGVDNETKEQATNHSIVTRC